MSRSLGKTTTEKPVIKISSVKIPNAAQASKPIVAKKQAKVKFGSSNNKVTAFQPPKPLQ